MAEAAPAVETNTPPAVTAPVIGTPEYDAAMIAKATGKPVETVVPPTETTTPPAVPPVTDAPATSTDTPVSLEVTPPATTETPPNSTPVVDVNALTSEYATSGSLSDESYAKLATAGIPKEMVDTYIAGQVALQQANESTIKAEVGGNEQYAKMANWAKTAMTPAEIASYNAAVNGKDSNLAKLAVKGLEAKYKSAVGSDPQLLNNGNASGSNAGSAGFQSRAQITAAMSDPRYAKDPAYRAQVEAKVVASDPKLFR